MTVTKSLQVGRNVKVIQSEMQNVLVFIVLQLEETGLCTKGKFVSVLN
jgi:hypothetical protein